MKNKQTAIRTAYFSLFGNLGLAIIKGVAGIFGNSYALIADAIESATDVFSSILVLLGLEYAKRPADDNHPYGHGKIEPIITFLIAARFASTTSSKISFCGIVKCPFTGKTRVISAS